MQGCEAMQIGMTFRERVVGPDDCEVCGGERGYCPKYIEQGALEIDGTAHRGVPILVWTCKTCGYETFSLCRDKEEKEKEEEEESEAWEYITIVRIECPRCRVERGHSLFKGDGEYMWDCVACGNKVFKKDESAKRTSPTPPPVEPGGDKCDRCGAFTRMPAFDVESKGPQVPCGACLFQGEDKRAPLPPASDAPKAEEPKPEPLPDRAPLMRCKSCGYEVEPVFSRSHGNELIRECPVCLNWERVKP